MATVTEFLTFIEDKEWDCGLASKSELFATTPSCTNPKLIWVIETGDIFEPRINTAGVCVWTKTGFNVLIDDLEAFIPDTGRPCSEMENTNNDALDPNDINAGVVEFGTFCPPEEVSFEEPVTFEDDDQNDTFPVRLSVRQGIAANVESTGCENQVDYPISLATVNDLFDVRNSARAILTQAWDPDDTSISVNSTDAFPEQGLITLIDQTAPIEFKALTVRYCSKTADSFVDIVIPEGQESVIFPRTAGSMAIMNVMAEHHNAIVDHTIAIERFIGTRGSSDLGTIEGLISTIELESKKPIADIVLDSGSFVAPSPSVVVLTVMGSRFEYVVDDPNDPDIIAMGGVPQILFEWSLWRSDDLKAFLTGESVDLIISDRSVSPDNQKFAKSITLTLGPGEYGVQCQVRNKHGVTNVIRPRFLKVLE